jgi:hypothetical protein
MAVLTTLSSFPPNRSRISAFSLSAFNRKMLASRPSTKMFFPLSLAVPPNASTVRPVIGTPT